MTVLHRFLHFSSEENSSLSFILDIFVKYLLLISALFACDGNKSDTSSPSETGSNAVDAPEMTAVLNEVCANASATEDWVEFYNPGADDADLTGAMIGDDSYDMHLISDLSEEVIVPAGGYLVVYTKVEKDGIEIGFGLKKDGSENLYFTVPNADAIDLLAIPEAEEDLTYGLNPDGGSNWVNGLIASPGESNAQ